MSFGAVALGMASYAMLMRDAELEPIPYMPYMLVVGAALVLAYLMFGQQSSLVVRVGELGVGVEDNDKVLRTSWWQIESVTVEGSVLSLKTTGKPIHLNLSHHGSAAARLIAEASKRIPERLELDDSDMAKIGAPNNTDGEPLEVDAPQVTGERCRATEQPLTFEKDVRMCNRCGTLYHRSGVPTRCAECGKKLKS